ncbi:MAG TPA: sulfatase-like hydrolase/transferase [Candidatus Heimdallarchaeota archaeon]|nr:sulfatase-like hydrolase/transferase [Candidatus Heimdallarchaeota archaeon]
MTKAKRKEKNTKKEIKKKTSPKKIVLPIILALVVVAAGVYLFFLPKELSFSRLKKNREFNYILITVDTLRADRVHCYGFPYVDTPTMDLFASKGVLFERCISQTPLTQPSHTSLLTGTYPLRHGVRDNGGFLVPQELVTLAEVFKEENYQTSAFVAAFVLDSKWGFNQGFDYYFDQFDLSKYKTISLGNVQRRGDEVIDETLKWLDEHKHEQFFTWVHLYDPHTPYEPPSPFREKYPDRPYLGEIAYTDSQLGRLWGYLEQNNLTENTILIFAADHGESLGEHQESTHGFFVYQAGIHVPLIFVTPFKDLHGIRRSEVVSLVDVMPTIMEMEGEILPPQIQGRSLLPLFFNDERNEESFAYSETYYPRLHYGWSDLKTIQEGRYKLIIAPELELYDLTDDPEEQTNLVSAFPEETRRLMRTAEQFIEESSQGAFDIDYQHIDEETRQKLAALGYIGTFSDQSSLEGKRLASPKEKIGIFNQLSQVKEWMLEEKYEEAVAQITRIINEDPDVIDAYFTLGNLYFKKREFDKALESFLVVLEKRPSDPFTVINVANSYMGMGEIDEADKFVMSIIESLPPDSQLYYVLGNIKNLKEEYEEAIVYYKECIKLNPSSASAYCALGGVYVTQERFDDAESYLLKAEEHNPTLRNLFYNWALLYEEKGELIKAADAYKAELENIPHNFKACFNLSRVYRKMGDVLEEENFLNKTMELNPDFAMSYFYLARIYMNRGERYDEAVSLVEKGIELKPTNKDLPLGYFLLADLYSRLGQNAKSEEYASKGKALAQENTKNNDPPK